MGIDTRASKTPLLEDADQNIGNSAVVLPQAGTAGTVIPQDLRNRIINLSNGGSARGQTTSVIMTARRIIGGTAENPVPGMPGPMTGVVEFGNGGRSTRVEFDIPLGPFVGQLPAASPAIEPQDGGVIVTVPTGVLRAYARYDNLLLAPVLGTSPPQSLAQLVGVAVVGPGGPFVQLTPEPLLVQAMAAYFSRPAAKVYKTLYCYCSLPVPVPTTVAVSHSFCLPAFAKTVKVLRLPLTAALDVTLSTPTHNTDQFAIAAGASAPTVDVVGHESIIRVVSHAPADVVSFLALVCEVGV